MRSKKLLIKHKKHLTKSKIDVIIKKKREVINMNKYNLNRIERHYMTEVMLSFENKHGREMTAEEIAMAVEKMRAKRAR
jgi:hypothetical protein